MKRNFLLLSFLLPAYFSIAQNAFLKGEVRDAVSREIIPGVNIFDSNDKSVATVSNENGNYELQLSQGRHTVTCSFVGMKNETVEFDFKAGETIIFNFNLNPQSKVLGTVVVSAGKYEQKLEDVTVSMEVLNSSLIENKNVNNITEALEQVPGLNILDNEPQIRGGSGFGYGVGSHVSVLVDGMSVMLGDQGRPEWSFIPTENVDQVEVIKGASSVLFGSSALSGVINVRTAFPKALPETKVILDYGQYDTPSIEDSKWWTGAAPIYGFSFLHSEKLLDAKNLDLVIGGQSRYNHNFIGPTGPAKGFPFQFDTTITEDEVGSLLARFNFSLRYRFKKIPGLAVGLAGNFMQSHDNRTLVWLNDSTGLYRAFPNTMTLYDMKIFYVDPFIEYYSKKGLKHTLKTRILHDTSDDNMEQGTTSTVYYEEYQIYKEFQSLKGLHFTGGVVGNQVQARAALYESSGKATNTMNNYAVYTQFDNKFKNVLNVSLGFRGEYYEINKGENVFKPVFRSGLSLVITKATFLRMSYGEAYRYPTINEKYIHTSEGGISILPNPDLKPETSRGFELGVKQGYKIGSFYGYIDAAAFWQEYENTIEFNYARWDTTESIHSAAIVGFKRVNTGSSRIRGLDFSVVGNGMLPGNIELTIYGGYTYSLPQSLDPNYVYATENTKYPLRPSELTYISTSTDTTDHILKYRFRHIAKLDAELSWKFIAIGGDVRYYSFMENIDKTFYDLDKPGLFPTGIKNYRDEHDKANWIYDARIRFRLNKIFSVSAIVNNAENKSYTLRPLKIESPRTLAFQIVAKF
jgi:outer membrane cobalamin receptor